MRSSPAVALRSANSISFDILTVVSLPSTETQLRKKWRFFLHNRVPRGQIVTVLMYKTTCLVVRR